MGILGPALLILSALSANAEDWGTREGVFHNTGNYPLYCYKDLPDRSICWTRVPPGGECRADAVGPGLREGVYKVPNRSDFNCWMTTSGGVSCEPADLASSVILDLARIKNGSSTYGNMSWEHFWELMTRGSPVERPLIECDASWQPVAQMCPRVTEPFASVYREMRSVTPTLEAVDR
jgi:hypothetical protein